MANAEASSRHRSFTDVLLHQLLCHLRPRSHPRNRNARRGSPCQSEQGREVASQEFKEVVELLVSFPAQLKALRAHGSFGKAMGARW